MPEPDTHLVPHDATVLIGRTIVRYTSVVGLALAPLLLVMAAWVGPALAALGALSAIVGGIALRQRGRPRPDARPALFTAAVGAAAMVPWAPGPLKAALVIALVSVGFVGLLSLGRRQALVLWIFTATASAATLLIMAGESAVATGIAASTGGLACFGAAAATAVRVTDVTRRSELRYRNLFEYAPVPVWEEDFTAVGAWLEGLRRTGVRDLATHLPQHPDEVAAGIRLIRVLDLNEQALTLTGLTDKASLLGPLLPELAASADTRIFIAQFSAIWESRARLVHEFSFMDAAGRKADALLYWSAPEQNGHLDLTRVAVAIVDISDRKAAERQLAAALQERNRRLRHEHAIAQCSTALLAESGGAAERVALEALLDGVQAAYAFLERNDYDSALGPCARRVEMAHVGGPPDPDPGILPWSSRPTLAGLLAKGESVAFIRHEVVTEGERHIETPVGSVLEIPIFVSGGWAGQVGFERRPAADRWENADIDFLSTAAEMFAAFWERQATRNRLEELIRSKDRFIASVSHELRTPLTAVVGLSGELNAGISELSDHDRAELTSLLAEQSMEMASIVEDLLVAARADIGRISVRPEEVDMRAQLEATLTAMRARHKKIEVAPGTVWAWADPGRVRQILRNLLTNAGRYGGDCIAVEMASGPDTIALLVKDDGPGIAEADRERIFEPYERAHVVSTQPASVGLGLTVSRQLARLMGGDLTYRFEEGFSVFELTLPAAHWRSQQAAAVLAHTT